MFSIGTVGVRLRSGKLSTWVRFDLRAAGTVGKEFGKKTVFKRIENAIGKRPVDKTILGTYPVVGPLFAFYTRNAPDFTKKPYTPPYISDFIVFHTFLILLMWAPLVLTPKDAFVREPPRRLATVPGV